MENTPTNQDAYNAAENQINKLGFNLEVLRYSNFIFTEPTNKGEIQSIKIGQQNDDFVNDFFWIVADYPKVDNKKIRTSRQIKQRLTISLLKEIAEFYKFPIDKIEILCAISD